MILNKENFELILFDLLEGNLPEKEKAQVLEQIENNPVWKKEWDMLKLTVLETDEELVFEHKAALLKNGGAARVIAFFPKYSSWAAAAAILFVAWIFWPKADVLSIDSVVIEHNTESTKKNTTIEAPLDTVSTEAIAAINNDKINATHPTNKINQPKAIEEKQGNRINKTTDNVAVNHVNKVELASNDAPNVPVVTLLLSPRIIPVSDANTTKETADSKVVYNEDAGLRGIVNRNINKALNPFKEPKFNIKTGVKDNNPTLMVSFSSRSYSADAQFLLKTTTTQ
jgi:hypothetical protein